LSPILNAGSVQYPAHDGVTQTDILDPPASNHNHRVLLEVVSDAGYIGSDLHTISQAHSGNFSDGGIWFPRRLSRHFGNHSPLERRIEKDGMILFVVKTARQSNRLGFASDYLPFASDELIYG